MRKGTGGNNEVDACLEFLMDVRSMKCEFVVASVALCVHGIRF